MQEFCHFLLFSGLITYVSLAPAIPNSRKPDLETIIDQTLKLSHNITPDPGEKRKLTIVSEEFNREDPKCVQTHIKMFIGGLQKKDQAIIENLREMATLFNASSCPSLNIPATPIQLITKNSKLN
ncbi:granulocyte-macrophage colony-stimulating factor isoform X2 [Sminthopsis crassicaudata]|uniref:granulocyte-macrophage colony-stimulating factor isoform X2 n=1 Tax=Sminthopsis crassicaudata TaxID=9301 RepID=UPI003D6920D1